MIPHNRPSFLGIGAQRAGTSWLYSRLRKHQEIWMPPVKEIHFFDRSAIYPSPNDLATASFLSRIIRSKTLHNPRMVAGIKTIFSHLKKGDLTQAIWWSKWIFGYYNENWYQGLFSKVQENTICGEITPSYSILEDRDIAKIKSLNSDIKLIYIIRNPVERAWSAIRFHAHMGAKINLDSADQIISILKHPAMFLRSDYECTIDKYLNHFDPSQFLLCFYDAIKNDTSGLMHAIANFLCVKPFDPSLIDNEILINPSPKHSMPNQVREYLLERYSPMTNRMAQSLGSYAILWNSTKGESDHPLPPSLHP